MSTTSDHIRRVVGSKLFIGAVNDDWRMFSDDPTDYTLGSPIGFGASSIVYVATYKPKDGSPSWPCAVKVVDLDKLPPASLRLLRRETQLMSLSKHPNVLRVRGSWMDGHKLYIALRLMNAGSAADVMHYGWAGGMEEDVVKCILKQALEGLNYLHVNGFIHRDIKAANLLIDDDGTVLLGDLGVAASLCDEESVPIPSGSGPKLNLNNFGDSNRSRSTVPGAAGRRLGKRKSFVGTPCWMAPELISGKQYDAKADIWSFGITAIELTQGRAPRSRETPARVLLQTVQNEPPSFSREGGQYKYSKAFKEIIESCLVKDPSRRPSAEELLEKSFFKGSKKKGYLVGAILKDLPPLAHRQERHVRSPGSVSKRGSIISSVSWDFSSNPVTPATANNARSYFPPTSPHLSAHPALNIPSPILYDEIEEKDTPHGFARSSHLAPPLQQDSSGSASRSTPSSPESSVFASSETSFSPSTTPDMGCLSLPVTPAMGSSAVTTPLSCSPAMGTMEQPLSRSNPKPGHLALHTSTVQGMQAKQQQPLHSEPTARTARHGSSPASAFIKPNLAPKRVPSAGEIQTGRNPILSTAEHKEKEKESKWRKLISSGTKGEKERRKNSFVERILS